MCGVGTCGYGEDGGQASGKTSIWCDLRCSYTPISDVPTHRYQRRLQRLSEKGSPILRMLGTAVQDPPRRRGEKWAVNQGGDRYPRGWIQSPGLSGKRAATCMYIRILSYVRQVTPRTADNNRCWVLLPYMVCTMTCFDSNYQNWK